MDNLQPVIAFHIGSFCLTLVMRRVYSYFLISKWSKINRELQSWPWIVICMAKFTYLSSCIDFIMTIHMSSEKYRCLQINPKAAFSALRIYFTEWLKAQCKSIVPQLYANRKRVLLLLFFTFLPKLCEYIIKVVVDRTVSSSFVLF